MTGYSYTSVPGSADLVTRPHGSHQAVKALEELDPAAPAGQIVEGEWLARCVVRRGAVAVLTDVYDRLALEQDAVEQALYGHLYRLALGEERNHCRVSRKDLMRRTGLTDRRLGKALAGLVDKGHVRLVHRDRRGTLIRVMLPHEVFAEPDEDRVYMARPPTANTSARPRPAAANETLLPMAAAPEADDEPSPPLGAAPASAPAPAGPIHGARTSGPKKGYNIDRLLEHQSMGALAADFCRRFGAAGRGKAEVVEAILDRLESGRELEDVARELADFGRRAPPQTPIADLERFLARKG